jgi:ATP-binding cassette subfamily F protein uup
VSKPVAAAKETAARPAPSRKRKLTFSDQHALKSLPAEIAGLEAKIAELQTQLSDGGLYARDPKRFTSLSADLAQAQNVLAECEHRWLELEMLREEIEQG